MGQIMQMAKDGIARLGLDAPGSESDQQEKIAAVRAGMPPGLRRMMGMKKGGSVKSSASRRADGIATKGKTKGRMI